MYQLEVTGHFDAAHWLPWHAGKCKNLHGHRWEVTVYIRAETLDENRIVMDFRDVKNALEAVLDKYDHCAGGLNAFIPNPTAEIIAREIGWELAQVLPIWAVKVQETPGCAVTYYYREECDV